MIVENTKIRRVLPWLGALALMIGAWGMGTITPPKHASEPAVVVTAELGERAVGRDIVTTVSGVRATEQLTGDSWSATGTWLIVDLEASSVRSVGSHLSGATLQLGDLTFRASERMPSLFGTALVAGVPRSGSIAFELPDDAFTGTGLLSLSRNADIRGDSVIQLRLNLDEVSLSPTAEMRPVGWSSP